MPDGRKPGLHFEWQRKSGRIDRCFVKKKIFKFNHIMSATPEYTEILKEIFQDRISAGSVVTKDIPDYAVAVGNPVKVIKILDKT